MSSDSDSIVVLAPVYGGVGVPLMKEVRGLLVK